jgi:hypothetical protein
LINSYSAETTYSQLISSNLFCLPYSYTVDSILEFNIFVFISFYILSTYALLVASVSTLGAARFVIRSLNILYSPSAFTIYNVFGSVFSSLVKAKYDAWSILTTESESTTVSFPSSPAKILLSIVVESSASAVVRRLASDVSSAFVA